MAITGPLSTRLPDPDDEPAVDGFDALTLDELLDLARREHANAPGATGAAGLPPQTKERTA